MRFIFGLIGLVVCLALSYPAAANDRDVPMHAARFVRALQAQRFDDAAAMFQPRELHAPAATAAQLKRVAERLGGFSGMRNVLSLPDGLTLKLELPSPLSPASRPNRYHQVKYSASASDGQPVFYILTLDDGAQPQPVLWFEVHLPAPDAASRARAEQVLRDILK